MVDSIEVVRELDPFDLTLGKLDEIVYDPFLIYVEVIHCRSEDIRLDYMPGRALPRRYIADVIVVLHGDIACGKDKNNFTKH